jgi:DNA-binding LacI/PurR family transcriptional regulator
MTSPKAPPPPPTVHQNFAEIGNQCVHNILRQIRNNTTDPGVTLVPRQSTAAPKE